MTKKKIFLPTISDVETDGRLLENYLIDESQTVSNAGEQLIYEYEGKKYCITEWFQNAQEHKAGSKEISEYVPAEIETQIETVQQAVNTGGHVYNDIVTLKNGLIIRISEDCVGVYRDEDADEAGEAITTVHFDEHLKTPRQ